MIEYVFLEKFMSSEKRIYLGGYLELPSESLKDQWDDLADYIKIHVDELVRLPKSSILISNYSDVNYADYNEEYQILKLTPDILSLMNLKFEVTHSEAIKKINEYHKDKFIIKVGFFSYCW